MMQWVSGLLYGVCVCVSHSLISSDVLWWFLALYENGAMSNIVCSILGAVVYCKSTPGRCRSGIGVFRYKHYLIHQIPLPIQLRTMIPSVTWSIRE